ncbi:MAG: Rab family GTPase [Methanomassiliicoccus sp.]|nr:Rab family GTPase [Methanomassiliicoccus sp.]
MEKKKIIRKVCLLGDGGVGKTSLIGRYVLNSFSDNYIMSFGTKVSKKVIELDDVQLTLMIWDILGQKSQKALHGAYYNGANGALLVCDNSRPDTLLKLPEWKRDLEEVTGTVPLIPLVNKADLPSSLGAEEVGEVKKVLGNDFLYTSAKTGAGVQDAFERLGRQILGVSP